MTSRPHRFNRKFLFLLFFTSWLLIIVPYRLKLDWATASFDQLLFHLVTGANFASTSDSSVLINFLIYYLLLPLALATFFWNFLWVMKQVNRWSDWGLRVLHERGTTRALSFVTLTFFGIGLFVFCYQLSIASWLQNINSPDLLERHYVAPKLEQFSKPKRHRNLILIYVESLERAFFEWEGPRMVAKPIGLLPGDEVRDFKHASGTEWSIAGMIASQCGLPLKNYIRLDSATQKIKAYFPNSTCLGDILRQSGYESSFLVGPSVQFTRMDLFYKSHGYQTALGRDEFREFSHLKPEDFEGWGGGLHDGPLLNEAFKIARKHHQKNTPFNLTLITTDSHGPEGFHSRKDCSRAQILKGFVGAMHCTSLLIAHFYDRLVAEGITENTDVIIMGDHLFMPTPDQLKTHFQGDRNIYFKLISSSGKKIQRNKMTHFDVFPTILDALELNSNFNGRAGLGYSLLRPDQTSYDVLYQAVIDPTLSSSSSTSFFDHWMAR